MLWSDWADKDGSRGFATGEKPGNLEKIMRSVNVGSLIAAAAFVAASGVALGQSFQLATETVVTGLSRPLFVTAPPGDTSRLFIAEQRSGSIGRVRLVALPTNALNPTPYLSITPVSTGSEQGLLGMTFHPNFAQNGLFYVKYTEPPVSGVSAGSTVVAEYRANVPYATSTTADATSARVLLRLLQPDANHNGGWIDFGPDGMLYIMTGDGGCANDQNCTAPNPPSVNPPGHTAVTGNAQDITDNLLGKLLRIDVDGPDNIARNADDDAFPADANKNYSIPVGNPFIGVTGDDEIWLYGLRNAWRNSFDRQTGELWIADVGQAVREEVNVVPAGASGLNYGWRCMEGTRCTGLTGCVCNAASLVPPIFEYGHTSAVGPTPVLGCSITGGYVYRGSAIPCFRGHYIFADYCSGDIYTFTYSVGGGVANAVSRRAELEPPGSPVITAVMSFGEDANGEIYICDQSGGEVFKIVPSAGSDCNSNSVPDNCDIAAGTSVDTNGNGIPDECECTVTCDFNQDGGGDTTDVIEMADAVAAGTDPYPLSCKDFNQDGGADTSDVIDIADAIASGTCP